MNPTPRLSPAALSAHAEWLRRLARHLLRDAPDAEDHAQEVLAKALRAPPDADRAPRPWLAEVLRNAVRSAGRARRRRLAVEQALGNAPQAEAPSAEEALARVQLQRRIAELTTSLEEPFRTTLLLKFHEGRDAPAIGRAMGVPAGTVRWRVSEGVRRLRERLDREAGGRRRWRALLAPLAGGGEAPSPPRAGRWPRAARVVAIAAGLAGAVAVVSTRAPAPPRPADAVPATARPAPRDDLPARTPNPRTEERADMKNENARRAGAAALVGVALPALVAGAQQSRPPAPPPPSFQAAVDLCVQMRERTFECKEEFADHFADRGVVRAEQREAVRKRALEEIVADGSGPLGPRQEKCAAMAKAMGDVPKEKIDELGKVLAACAAKPDCAARLVCLAPFMQAGMGKKRGGQAGRDGETGQPSRDGEAGRAGTGAPPAKP